MKKQEEKKPSPSSSYEGEKLPPHNVEAEEAVIASVLVDPECITGLLEFLKPDHFFRDKNGWVYGAELDLYGNDKPIDQITVSQRLAETNRLDRVGGSAYLSHLVSMLPTSVNALFYARIVRNLAVQRRIIEAAGKISLTAWGSNGEASQILEKCCTLLEVIWEDIGQQPMAVSGLEKVGHEDPVYYLQVNNTRIKLTGEDLLSYKKFRMSVCHQCGFVPPKMKEEDWLAKINRLLQSVKVDRGPVEASPEQHIWQAARRILKEMQIVATLDEFRAGKALEKGSALYIKGDPFFTQAKQKLKMSNLHPTRFWSIMRERGVKDTTTRIEGKTEGCWRVPLEALEEQVVEEIEDELVL